MNTLVYIGIVLCAIGFFTWLFGASRLRGAQHSFAPVSAGKIKSARIVAWCGSILFFGGILLSIFTFGNI